MVDVVLLCLLLQAEGERHVLLLGDGEVERPHMAVIKN